MRPLHVAIVVSNSCGCCSGSCSTSCSCPGLAVAIGSSRFYTVHSAQLDKVMAFDYCRGLGYNCVSYFAVSSHFTCPLLPPPLNRIRSVALSCAYDPQRIQNGDRFNRCTGQPIAPLLYSILMRIRVYCVYVYVCVCVCVAYTYVDKNRSGHLHRN